MLQLIDNKTVRGDGFIVSVPDIHHIRYTEGEKVAKIEIEGGATKPPTVDWIIYAATLRCWEPPHITEELNRDEILSNITTSLKLLGMAHKVE